MMTDKSVMQGSPDIRRRGRLRLAGVLAALACAAAVAQGQWSGDIRRSDTLAVVGDAVISAGDYVERFELQAWPNKESSRSSDEIRRDVLHSLVAEKLLAHEAAQRGLGTDRMSADEHRMLERLFVRDELYRHEVRNKARASQQEIDNGLRRYSTSVRIALFRVASAVNGHRLLQRLRSRGRNSSKVPLPSDTVVVNYGLSERALEDSVYASPDSCLGPLQSELYGWVVAKVLDRFTNPGYASKSWPDRLEEVTKAVKLRNEDSIASAYVASVLRWQRAELQRGSFDLLVDSLCALFTGTPQHYLVKGWYILSPEGLDSLMERLAARLNENAVTIASGSMTLRDVLIGLKVTANEFPSAALDAVRRTLRHMIGVVIRDELIAREGLKTGMQDSSAVRHDLNEWTEARRAALLQQLVIDSVDVSESEITNYFNRNSRAFGIETSINLQEILSATDSAAQSLKRRIQSGEDMARLARRYSVREEWRMNDGVSGFFPASRHPDLAFQAVVADSGVVTGPFRVNDGFTIFRVLGIRQDQDTVRGHVGEIRERIRERLFELKAKRKLDNFIGGLAAGTGVSLREDRLRKIDVTPTSMMTWRYIGFGGRINAVPTLIEQTGWVNRWIVLQKRNEGPGVLP